MSKIRDYLELQDLIDKANALREHIAEENEELYNLKETIKTKMKAANIKKLEGSTGKANFFYQERTLLDTAKFRKRCPKIFERYAYSSWSDTLRLSTKEA